MRACVCLGRPARGAVQPADAEEGGRGGSPLSPSSWMTAPRPTPCREGGATAAWRTVPSSAAAWAAIEALRGSRVPAIWPVDPRPNPTEASATLRPRRHRSPRQSRCRRTHRAGARRRDALASLTPSSPRHAARPGAAKFRHSSGRRPRRHARPHHEVRRSPLAPRAAGRSCAHASPPRASVRSAES